MNDEIVNEIWKQQREWSAAANKLKENIVRWRAAVLLFAISGAFLATLATQVPNDTAQHIIAWLGAVSLAIIPVVTPRKLSALRTQEWTRARSVSEGLKAELFSFFAKADPYSAAGDSAVQILRDRCYKITQSAEDLMRFLSTIRVDAKSPPKFNTPEDYLEQRIDDQIDWYLKKAGIHMDRSSNLRSIEFYLAVAAALLAAASGIISNSMPLGQWSIDLGVWVAVLTTIGGTLTAHIAAARYDHIVISYSATAHQLRHLKNQWPPSENVRAPSTAWSEFVRQCEDAISKENESWIAKWVKEDS